MFLNVEIKGFRGISDLKIKDFKQYNLIVGRNGSCKTSILESLFILVNPTAPDLPVRTNVFRGLDIISENTLGLFFHNFDYDTAILLKADMIGIDKRRILRIRPRYGMGISIEGQNGSLNNKSLDERFFQSGTFPTLSGVTLESTFIDNEGNQKQYVSELSIEKESPEIKKQAPKDYTEKRTGIYLSPEIFARVQTAAQLNSVLIRKRKNQILNVLKQLEPAIEDITIGLDSVVFCDLGLPKMVPINVLGSGMYKMLSVVLAIENTQGGTVFIDEIENGLSPSSLDVMWKAILISAKEFDVQIFATSHSLECIRSMGTIAGQRLEHLEDDIRIYRIEKQKQNFEAIGFNINDIKVAIDKEWDLR
jgi:AAA15 family ATPase/GTPase